MEPKDINDGPSAMRTVLGWTVIGFLKDGICKTNKNSIGYIK